MLSFPIAFPDSSVSVTSPVLWPSPTIVPSMGIACLGIQFPTGSHESGFEDTYRHFKVEPPVAPGAKRAAVAAIYRFESIVVCSCLLHGVLCRLSRLCSAKCGPRNFLGLSTCWMRHRHETDDTARNVQRALCAAIALCKIAQQLERSQKDHGEHERKATISPRCLQVEAYIWDPRSPIRWKGEQRHGSPKGREGSLKGE